MKNRILFVALLVALLIGIFFYQPILFPKKPYPSIEDRLPDAPIIGKINLIELTDKIVPLLFKQKIAYRDFISTDFILTQAKSGGIDVQKPIYFYSTDEDEMGILMSVSDSSKVPAIISKLSSFYNLQDTIIGTHLAHKITTHNIYISYERNWMFIYKGKRFIKHYFQIKFADNTSRRKRWKDFLADKNFENHPISISFRSKATAKKGLDHIGATFEVDSNYVYLTTYLQDQNQFPLQLKEHGKGLSIDEDKSKYYADIHLSIPKKVQLEETYIYDLILPFTQKVNFPLKAFLAGWGGDLSLDIDRSIKIKESYIDTEFDDNFNAIEKEKFRWVDRRQFIFFATAKENYYRDFVNQMYGRGFLRKEGDALYLLTIPFINIIQKEKQLYLYSGYFPAIEKVEAKNTAVFLYDNDEFKFQIDTIRNNEMQISGRIPFSYFIKKYNIKTK